ncbi:BMP-binding endothelial regulator protein-like [Macrobrachium nipponense]|uniref:BMP-binding endothelial regulator protein-like n=1 Tax=Macrobrachium nipponense TaxID=159736 RepID=UPI0030C848E1
MIVTRAPKPSSSSSSSSTPVPCGGRPALSQNPAICLLTCQSPCHPSVIQSASNSSKLNSSGSLLSKSSSSGSPAPSKCPREGPLAFRSQSEDAVVLTSNCEEPVVLRSHCEEPLAPRSHFKALFAHERSHSKACSCLVPVEGDEMTTPGARLQGAGPTAEGGRGTCHISSRDPSSLLWDSSDVLDGSRASSTSAPSSLASSSLSSSSSSSSRSSSNMSPRAPLPTAMSSGGVFRRLASMGGSGRPRTPSKGLATPLWPLHAQQSSRAHSWSSRGRSLLGWAFLWMTLQLVVLRVTPVGAQVVGENMRCHQEGEAVAVPKELFKDNPCLECVCENGIVVCNKRKCPSMEGCYWRLEAAGGSCCQDCKGCIHEGRMHKHGTNWTDGCSHYECQSGVLTVSQSQCHLPCYRSLPLQEGQCCQKCQGCWFEGRSVPEGETVSSRADPCIQCACSKGNLSCEKKACPVLSCPPSRQVPVPNSCCKTCIGSRNLLSPPNGRCFLNSHLYLSGGERTIDPCTVCTCHHGYITCQRRTCPVLNCSREFQIVLENECCPTCSAAAELENVCRVPGMVRKHGEEWQLEKCMSCRCANGETSCWTISCEYGNKPCPPGFKRIETEDECCPRCEEAPGVCTVFGDPHYLTFDGMLFNFQGACRYTLVRSCKGNAFSLKVNNDARRSALFSWTKSLLLTLPGMKVKLGQKLRTKVNKRRIKMKYPYNDPSGLIITREGLAMKISTPEGIKILWDGASYVEVEVPLHMQGKVCGLCGNFNRNITDDLTTYDGKMMETPDQMAMSWSIGKPKKCSVKMKKGKGLRLQRQNCPESKEGLTQCSLLNNTMFQSCHAVAPIDQFYNSCILDMCECKSSRRCECDTIQAYARHCERLGIAVPDWRKISNCGGLECPHGAEYMECAPPCRPTCRNPNPNLDCYTRRCREGCFCPPKTVLHRGTCIPTEDCPNKGRKRHRNS